MERLTGAIGELKALIEASPLVAARVFELPLPAAGEEGLPAAQIPVRTVEGEEALALALHAFGRFHALSGQSTRSVYRLPGVLCLNPTEPRTLLAQLATVNQLKTDFLCLVRQLPDRTTRFEVVHRLFPMALTLQITRQIQGYAEPMKSATFTWGKKTALRRITRDEVIELLYDMREQIPARLDPETWYGMLDQDIVRVQSLPTDVPLRYRRELKVRPLCNLLLDDGQKWLREANLPILLLGPADGLRLGYLAHYDAYSSAPRRGRKSSERLTEEDRILLHLPIYRVRADRA
jgi:DNA replication terminus site-binding protein